MRALYDSAGGFSADDAGPVPFDLIESSGVDEITSLVQYRVDDQAAQHILCVHQQSLFVLSSTNNWAAASGLCINTLFTSVHLPIVSTTGMLFLRHTSDTEHVECVLMNSSSGGQLVWASPIRTLFYGGGDPPWISPDETLLEVQICCPSCPTDCEHGCDNPRRLNLDYNLEELAGQFNGGRIQRISEPPRVWENARFCTGRGGYGNTVEGPFGRCQECGIAFRDVRRHYCSKHQAAAQVRVYL